MQVFEKNSGVARACSDMTEPPFKLTQLVVPLVVALLAIVAAIRFHPEPIRTT